MIATLTSFPGDFFPDPRMNICGHCGQPIRYVLRHPENYKELNLNVFQPPKEDVKPKEKLKQYGPPSRNRFNRPGGK